MFYCKSMFRVAALLLSLQVSSLQALPVNDKPVEMVAATEAAEQSKLIPLAPPGPYFSSATPRETATSEPIQMPATAPVTDQAVESSGNDSEPIKSANSAEPESGGRSLNQQSDVPENNQSRNVSSPESDQKINQQRGAYDIELTNPLAEWPGSVESNPQWAPAPPGPYGFVPDYIPRSMANPTNQYGQRSPYNTSPNNIRNNPYAAPYGRPAPGMMRPQMGRGYSNPGSNPGYLNQGYPNQGYSNQGYYYSNPNPGGYYQDNVNRGGYDPRFRRNNLNQNDMNQAKPK